MGSAGSGGYARRFFSGGYARRFFSGGYARRFFSGEKADPEVQIIAWTAAPGSTSRERLARLRTLA